MGGERVKFFILGWFLLSTLFSFSVEAKTNNYDQILRVLDTNNNQNIETLEILDLSLALLGYTDFASHTEYDVNNDLLVDAADKKILSQFLVKYEGNYQTAINAINSIDINFDQIISEEEINAYKANFYANENTDDIRILSKYDSNYDQAFDYHDAELIDYIINQIST